MGDQEGYISTAKNQTVPRYDGKAGDEAREKKKNEKSSMQREGAKKGSRAAPSWRSPPDRVDLMITTNDKRDP